MPAENQIIISDAVSGRLHEPVGDPIAAAVITHGAGSDHTSRLLELLATGLSDAGVLVARIDLSFRRRRPKGPPSAADAVRDRDGLRAACAWLTEATVGTRPLILGGQSYGGRQASMLLAEIPDVADGLLLTSYPLHPPGKPERARTEHLPALRCPTVVVHGSSDPFASTAEITEAIDLIAGPTRLVEIAKTGHDLRPERSPAVADTIAAVLDHLVRPTR